ncbi:porin [Pseudoalteromonas sp. JBTF-M23]|uniref:Porin n=1 Tax=Pseudoalteromonas caenipelagi TaxID=2726988 RepID=A0A849VEC4_9GAMM|nr:porin [Pseudoalteromonas caenipelagi]NOU51636.1 porin [Pseudoalteromonas caenipelagi]
MKINVPTVLCSSLLVLSSFANAEAVKVYGRVHAGVQYSDIASESDTSIESYASRLGLKGDAKINDGLEVFFKYEFEVNPADNDKDGKSGENITARSQYVGLKGNLGQVLIGRDDTAMKKSQGKVDMLNDFEADIKTLFVGENRLGDTIQYSTPEINHLKFVVSYIAEDNSKQKGESGLSVAAMYGDSALKKTPVYISVAHDEEVAGQDINRITVQGKMGNATLGGIYQQSEKVDSNNKVDSFMVSASYKIESYKLLAQYQDSDGASGKLSDSGNATSIGVEKSLSKQARMYFWYSQFDLDNNPEQEHMALTLRYDF